MSMPSDVLTVDSLWLFRTPSSHPPMCHCLHLAGHSLLKPSLASLLNVLSTHTSGLIPWPPLHSSHFSLGSYSLTCLHTLLPFKTGKAFLTASGGQRKDSSLECLRHLHEEPKDRILKQAAWGKMWDFPEPPNRQWALCPPGSLIWTQGSLRPIRGHQHWLG